MSKEELIKELERLKAEYKKYSNNTSMNEGYRVAIMDAIDLVKKLNIDDVSKSLCDVCGSDDVAEYPHVGFTCYNCNPM